MVTPFQIGLNVVLKEAKTYSDVVGCFTEEEPMKTIIIPQYTLSLKDTTISFDFHQKRSTIMQSWIEKTAVENVQPVPRYENPTSSQSYLLFAPAVEHLNSIREESEVTESRSSRSLNSNYYFAYEGSRGSLLATDSKLPDEFNNKKKNNKNNKRDSQETLEFNGSNVSKSGTVRGKEEEYNLFYSNLTAGGNAEKGSDVKESEYGYGSASVSDQSSRRKNVSGKPSDARVEGRSCRENSAVDETLVDISDALENDSNDSSELRHSDTDSEAAEETDATSYRYVHRSLENITLSSAVNEETDPQAGDVETNATWTTTMVSVPTLFAYMNKKLRDRGDNSRRSLCLR